MSTNKGLGRGLDALWNSTPKSNPAPAQTESNSGNTTLALDKISPNPNQPRRTFVEASLQELADSIKAQGIIQPLLVRPSGNGQYQIVAGERRWRAARMAGLKEVPVVISDMDDQNAMAAALIENLQREDLNPMEEAQALQALKDTLGLTQEELAARVGKSRPAIANALRLLQLDEAAQECLREGKISAGHARALLGVGNQDAAGKLLQHIINNALNVREAEDAAASFRDQGHFPWEPKPDSDDQANEGTSAGTEQAKKPSSPQDAALQDVARELRSLLPFKINIKGDMNEGRITFAYSSIEDLQSLLAKLGLNVERQGE